MKNETTQNSENKQIKKALNYIAKLTAAIEDMEYDCDGEIYETLLKIQDVLES